MTFVITTRTHSELRARVLLLFYRMAVPVRALSMNPIDDERSRLTVDVETQPGQSEQIATNLAKIVHAFSVQEKPIFTNSKPPRERQHQRNP